LVELAVQQLLLRKTREDTSKA